MDYYVIYTGLIQYLAGCLTIFLLFNRKILDTATSPVYNPNQYETVETTLRKMYALLANTINLSLYEKTIDAIELERERIGMDIHDELASQFASIYIDLEILLKNCNALLPHETKILLNMRHKTRHAVESLRKIIHGMHPATLEAENLDQAVNDLCLKHNKTQGTAVMFRSVGNSVRLSAKVESYIYRIIQEVITNSIKHSLAWQVYVSLFWSETGLRAVVKDTGKGMPQYIEDAAGYGITGLFLRSTIIGASAKFNTPHKGMEFELTLDFPPQDDVLNQAV